MTVSGRFTDCINNRSGNYIAPFFWQHGEDDETLIREIDAIYESGIRALCVEARPFEEFCEEPWWHTMGLILEHCRSLDMKVWLLDDKHFPSGYANGLVAKKYPDERMWSMSEKHIDVVGPMKDAAVLADYKKADNEELIGIVAYRRLPHSDILTGEPLVLTDKLYDGMVYFNVPEGCWRIYCIFRTQRGYDKSKAFYADKLTEKGGDIFIEAVYEPHYEHFKEYFGNTFVGFFSDEPCFCNNTDEYFRPDLGRKYSYFPYAEEVLKLLEERFGSKAVSMLPGLWAETEDSTESEIRLAYMDIITMLYRRYFSYKLGDWCRAHGVEYIGHIIEDDHQHLCTRDSAGHFFRALDGQDMAGIDVVLCQTVPGFEDYTNKVPCGYDVADADFFHFMLPKLGTSHAHIQSEKKNRCMCEIFGAYGWAEGLKMMKWLSDFMMVRGVNFFVPHAFSPKFPDPDCPPHFYAGGTNPQFKDFRILMDYMNRICHLQNGARQAVTAGVLYYAEAAWSGGKFMRTDVPVRYLTEHQIDCDIISSDYLKKATVSDKKLCVGSSICSCLVLPYAEYQSEDIITIVESLSAKGLPVYIIDGKPQTAETHTTPDMPSEIKIISLDELDGIIRSAGFADVTLSEDFRSLRFCHTVHGSSDYYFLTNEAKDETMETEITVSAFGGGKFIRYDAMANTAVSDTSLNGKIKIKLEPYGSTVLVFGEETDDIPEFTEMKPVDSVAVDNCWNISTAEQKDYPEFTVYKENSPLFNITGPEGMTRFAGHIRYEKEITIPENLTGKNIILDFGYVGESATLCIDGKKVCTKIAPPYRYDITGFVKSSKTAITLDVTTHYGYQFRDHFSKYLLFEPSGLLGPVSLEVSEKIK